MPRRPRSADDDISLFPFLSIIACVIGVLTMMIATLALAQTDTPDVALIEKYEQTQKQLADADQRIKELELSNATALEIQDQKRQLTMTLSELESLLAELEQVELELAEQKEVEVVIPPIDPKARETAADMQAELVTLKEQVAQLEKELAQRKESSEANVTVLPQGSGLNFKPHFVECAAGSIVMHNLATPKRIRAADIAKDKDFTDLLNLVVNGKDDSIVFLVRSDALATYRACKDICTRNQVRNGKIPIVGKGRIDLSAFAARSEP